MSDYEDRVAALGPSDRATHTWLMNQSAAHRAVKNYDGADLARERANEILYPERRAQREAYEQRSAEFERNQNLQPRQFFHGTDANLRKGDQIRPASALGRKANWPTKGNQDWAYAAESTSTASEYAEKVAGMRQSRPRVYQVEPTGNFEPDPHDANGLRSSDPWRVVRRVPRNEWDA